MSRPVLLMCPLFEPTQRELESTWQVQRYYQSKDKEALLAEMAQQCEVVVTAGGRGIEAECLRLVFPEEEETPAKGAAAARRRAPAARSCPRRCTAWAACTGTRR